MNSLFPGIVASESVLQLSQHSIIIIVCSFKKKHTHKMSTTSVSRLIFSLIAVAMLLITLAPESEGQLVSRGVLNNARRQLRRGNACPFCQYCQYSRFCNSPQCGPFSPFRNVCEFCEYSYHCSSTCRTQC